MNDLSAVVNDGCFDADVANSMKGILDLPGQVESVQGKLSFIRYFVGTIFVIYIALALFCMSFGLILEYTG